MRIVCVSDTHLRPLETVPDGDLLIHAGDFTMTGTMPEVKTFNRWLAALPHAHKVVIAGNHDFAFEQEPALARRALTGGTYLEDELTEVEGLRIWGSPWQPRYGVWAFNLDRGEAIRAKWDLIPEHVDVLVTHGPPAGIGDRLATGEHVGCKDLLHAVERLHPKLHVFGHIHEGYGTVSRRKTTFVNASICDFAYRATNTPIVIDL